MRGGMFEEEGERSRLLTNTWFVHPSTTMIDKATAYFDPEKQKHLDIDNPQEYNDDVNNNMGKPDWIHKYNTFSLARGDAEYAMGNSFSQKEERRKAVMRPDERTAEAGFLERERAHFEGDGALAKNLSDSDKFYAAEVTRTAEERKRFEADREQQYEESVQSERATWLSNKLAWIRENHPAWESKTMDILPKWVEWVELQG